MELEIKKLINKIWKDVKNTTHISDMEKKEKNYITFIKSIPDFITDIEADIESILRS